MIIAMVLTITNTLAFSRCDEFSPVLNLTSNALHLSGLTRSVAGDIISRLFNRG